MLRSTKKFAASVKRMLLGIVLCFCALFSAASVFAQEFLELSVQPQEGFGRIVLNFPDRLDLPPYTLRSENNVLSIEFEEPIQVVLPDVSDQMRDYLTVARIDPDFRGIRLGLLTDFRVNSMIAGEQLYIDLLPLNWQGLPPSLPADVVAALAERARDAAAFAEQQRIVAQARELQPTANLSVGYNPSFIRVSIEWSAPTTAEYIEDDEYGTLKFAWPTLVDAFALTQNLPPEILEIGTSSEIDASFIDFEFAPGVTSRFFEESETSFFLDIDRLNPASGAPTAEELLVAAQDEIAFAREQEAARAAMEEVTDAPKPVPETELISIVPQVSDIGSAVRIYFPFNTPTPAAAFRRGNYVWALFDSTAAVLEPDNFTYLNNVATDYVAVSAGETQIVRMKIGSDDLFSLGSQGNGWVLSLGELVASSGGAIQVNRRQDPSGLNEVAANLGDPARIHDIFDSEVGDMLQVVTMFPPARGVQRDQKFVEFDILGSAHGFVVRPKSENIDLELSRFEAKITKPSGLIMSPLQTSRLRLSDIGDESLESVGLGLFDYVVSHPARLQAQISKYENEAALADGREKQRARMNLANTYLANQFAEEAIGIYDVLLESNDSETIILEALINKAGATVTARRFDEAVALLTSERLRSRPDGIMWRTIARVESGDYANAHLDALASEAVMGGYPQWVQVRFLTSGITAAIEERDLETARRFSSKLAQINLDDAEFSRFELLQGRIDELEERYDEALDTYGQIILADIRLTRAEAIYRTIDLLNRIGEIDLERATQVLSTETITWRGDQLEAKMLGLLANLQFKQGDYRGAFATVREAAEAHVQSDEVQRLSARAQEVFGDLFLNGGSDSLEAIDALTLFYTYRHLTPAGTRGDEMIRNLARRLVRVDLLEQAANLLEYQIENRLTGAAKAQIATDLAVVHLADRAPEKAMEALKSTAMPNLAPSLQRQRRVLEARALIDAGRSQLALDMLSNLDGRDAEVLRIDANWRDRRFGVAAEQIEFIYSADGVPETLGQVGRRQLLKAAVGFVLVNDRIGLARLRQKFSGVMEVSPEWPMFDYVTGVVTQDSSDFRQLASEVAGADSLAAFLASYSDVYEPQGALAPLNVSSDIDT